MTPIDTLIIIAIAIVGVGGAKVMYAALAVRASQLVKNNHAIEVINKLAACVMIAVGAALLARTWNWI